MSQDSIQYLLQSRCKAGEIQSGHKLFKLAWLLPICSILLMQLPEDSPKTLFQVLYGLLLWGCGIGLGLSTLISVAKRVGGSTSLHSTLLKGRSYPELWMSGVQPRSLVDGIASHNVPAVWPTCGLPALCAFLIGAGLFDAQMTLQCCGNLNAVMAGLMHAAGLCAIFFLCCFLGTVWASYLAQWNLVSGYFSARSTNIIQVCGTVLALAALYLADNVTVFFGVASIVYLGSLLLARWAVIRSLSRLEAEGDFARRGQSDCGPANPWLIRYSDNPIVFRHSIQHARRVGGGLPQALFARFPLMLILVAFLLLATYNLDELWFVFGALGCLQFIRTAVAAGSAVSSEFEQGTLESLTCTRTNNQLFYGGWSKVVLWPLAVENSLLGLLMLLGTASVAPKTELLSDVGLAALLALYLQFVCVVAFSLGFYCSCQPSAKTSQSRLFEHLLAVFVLVPTVTLYLGAMTGVAFHQSNTWFVWVVLIGLVSSALGLAGIARFYRGRALVWLNTDRGRDVSGNEPKTVRAPK